MNEDSIPLIVTSRLRLRARRPDDAEALFPDLADPELMTFWSRPPFADVEDVRGYFAPDPDGRWQGWAITLEGEDRALGFVSAGEKRPGVVEIGYFLGRAAQGRGFAAEAVSGLVSQLFAEGYHRVFADTDPDNLASIALLTRLGFQMEGRLRGEWRTHIGVRDSLIFGLLAGDWRG